ncbi:hypothetical protein PTSG_00404 [Salpingoeca rosetta]|uniref:PPIase FKBP-type domain-containing protein n=1 Tax=Salpingoeca rosetta (strain ATCC 50818 / BSB-021) TaxID=946362 RepID=F2TWD7_SALR5|nr:uncharacterized protein PTSG_00404 [Salpingoeca rosetta]EGD72383.1 hypothetical protein PTSG_00404 [Salpingoeca rosetta]|eukprot:XP_004998952.1 hypothetical protein PTSG_00404 [Salpingoeca rosetta]
MTSDQDKVVDVAEVGDGSGGDDGEWEDILGTGALLKKVLAAGDADGVRPMRGCIADITVSCTVNDKNLMEEERTQFQIGEGERHTAWDIAVPLMVKGEHALIKTEKRFVSFDKEDLGDEPEIVFDIQLHSFEETTPDDLMTTEQRIEFA